MGLHLPVNCSFSKFIEFFSLLLALKKNNQSKF